MPFILQCKYMLSLNLSLCLLPQHVNCTMKCFLSNFDRFNEFSSMAVQALEDVHFRGCYECLPDIMLVAGAIRNSIKDTPSGIPSKNI